MSALGNTGMGCRGDGKSPLNINGLEPIPANLAGLFAKCDQFEQSQLFALKLASLFDTRAESVS
ncbi:hypothetical protein PhaeoP97_02125 [Phaeobacter porticola]|uniref:Uncharacterized protein n=1 Tax=Phaeobacter porticola TaxID=1844006 RepID=A0A1L3I5X4_9RHOB|nr:hypothetical protein PhaeoP97_02125 [Phaeobacter porticola]